MSIPAGIEDGNNIRFKGKGNNGGDLDLRVNVKKSPGIERVGIDVHTIQEISIVDAVLGCEVDVKTIYG